MSIQRFFDKDVVVRRLSAIGGGIKESFQATATVEGHIQSLDAEARQKRGILEERAWVAWFDVETDIKEEDHLTDPNSNTYIVREITKRDYGINQHLEVLMMELNA